jgi:hypothetical protein
MKEDAQVLSRPADWYRGYAEVACQEKREELLKLAQYLDLKPTESDKRVARLTLA